MEQLRCARAGTTAELGASIFEHDRVAALESISSMPAAVMVGTLDLLCPPSYSHVIASALPNATLTVFNSAGHILPFERSREVAARLRLLGGTSAQTTNRRDVVSKSS